MHMHWRIFFVSVLIRVLGPKIGVGSKLDEIKTKGNPYKQMPSEGHGILWFRLRLRPVS